MKKTNNNELFAGTYVAPSAKVINVTLHRVLCSSDEYGDVNSSSIDGENNMTGLE